jgi:transposase
MDTWIGIDVSKANLIACLIRSPGKPIVKEFKNDPSGFAKLLRWAMSFKGEQLHFCMESTGPYSLQIATFLAEAEQTVSVKVSVANPARIKYFGMSKGILNKTDKADARLIALYCKEQSPEPWRQSRPEVRQLIALMRRLAAVQEHLNQEKNRLQEPGLLKEVQRSIKTLIRQLEAEIRRLEKSILDHIDRHPDLKADKELLLSIKGIGNATAHWILAELPDTSQFENATSAAAYAGLCPTEYSSGTSVKRKTRLSKAGNKHLRRALYMPAISAIRFNPIVADLYNRLVARGMNHKAALGAAMRKLLMLAYGVLKTRTNFDPCYQKSAA